MHAPLPPPKGPGRWKDGRVQQVVRLDLLSFHISTDGFAIFTIETLVFVVCLAATNALTAHLANPCSHRARWLK